MGLPAAVAAHADRSTTSTSSTLPPSGRQWLTHLPSTTRFSERISTPTSIKIQRLVSGATSERGLLDTSVAIRIDAFDLDRLPLVSAVSCLTLAELSSGPYAAKDAFEGIRRLRHVRKVEAQIVALPFETECAHAYGRIHAAVATIGRKPRGGRAIDLMIAAAALAYDLPLYTLNAADLRGLGKLIEIVDLSQ